MTLPPISHAPITFEDIRRLIGADARTILEIGAHHGWHTAEFLRVFPEAAIHAFEPDPRALLKFRETIADPRVTLHDIAIGAADGTTPFHVSSGLPPDIAPEYRALYPQGWDQSGSLRAPRRHLELWPWCRFDQTITVTVRGLDSWADQHGIGPVDFIWADMQGAEGDLAAGGARTLAQTRYLYTEYSDQEIYEGEPGLEALLAMLPDFAAVRRYPNDILLRNRALTPVLD